MKVALARKRKIGTPRPVLLLESKNPIDWLTFQSMPKINLKQ